MRTTQLALAGLALALAAACGTTVPVSRQAGAPSALGGSEATTSQPTVADPGQAGTTPGAVAPGSAAQSGGPATTSTGGRPAAPGATTQVPRGAGSVPTARGTVEVGFLVAKDLGPATKALGVDGLSSGDGANQVRASVALLNSRGGLNGATVKPVILEQDATQSAQTQWQRACSLFFDDHKVVAVVGWGFMPVVQACAAQHKVPFVTSGNRTTSQQELAKYANVALPAQLVLERFVPTWVPALKQQGYFAPRTAAERVKVGLIYNEDSDYAQVPGLVEQQLKRFGLTLAEKQSMPGVDDSSRVTAASNAGSSAVLRFKTAGVTHVLVADKSGQAIAYFGLAAQNQGYYPQYGVSSLELPAALRTVLSARQLEGARGIGWLPSTDVPASKAPAATGNGAACVKALTKAGEDMELAATRGPALATCDSALVLGAALRGQPLTLPGFLAGLDALGRGWGPVVTLTTDFGGRRDGASSVRPLAYQPGCDCFAYTGPTRSVA